MFIIFQINWFILSTYKVCLQYTSIVVGYNKYISENYSLNSTFWGSINKPYFLSNLIIISLSEAISV